MTTKTYNGYDCWNTWNVSLWINNDELLYREAYETVQKYGKVQGAKILYDRLKGTKTPDGARYTLKGIKAAISDY